MAVGKFEWEKAIRDFSTLPPGVRLVALALCTWMDAKTGEAYPSIDTLKKATGQGRSTVIRHVNTLDSTGWIDRRRGGGTDASGKGIPTWYFARIPLETQAAIAERNTTSGSNSPNKGPPTVPTEPPTVPTEPSNSPTTSTGTTNNNQEQPAALTPGDIQAKYPEIWTEAINTTWRRSNVRNPEAFALKIARDLLAQQSAAANQIAENQRELQRMSDCGECTSVGMVEVEGEWVRCHHRSQ